MFWFLKRTDLRMADDRLLGRVGWGAVFEPIEPGEIVSANERGSFLNWGPWLVVRTDAGRFHIRGTRKDYDEIVRWISEHTPFHVDETIGYRWSRLLWRTNVSMIVAAPLRLLRSTRERPPVAEETEGPRAEEPVEPDGRTLTRIRSVGALAMLVGGIFLVGGSILAALPSPPPPPPGAGPLVVLLEANTSVITTAEVALGIMMLLSGLGFRRRLAWARAALLGVAWVMIVLLAVVSASTAWEIIAFGGMPVPLAILLLVLLLLQAALGGCLLAMAIRVLTDRKVKQAMRH